MVLHKQMDARPTTCLGYYKHIFDKTVQCPQQCSPGEVIFVIGESAQTLEPTGLPNVTFAKLLPRTHGPFAVK